MYSQMMEVTGNGRVKRGFAWPGFPKHIFSKPCWSVVCALAWIAFAGVIIANAGNPRVPPSGMTTCRIIQHPAALGPQSEAKMKVGSGLSCSVRVELMLDSVQSILVISGPWSGSLSVVEHGAFYKSDPKFKGQDSFALTVAGSLRSEPASITVHVQAIVE